MIEVSKQKTNNPVYSMGRRNMNQEQIWETEDNGGFDMITVMGEARNCREYTEESVKKAVDDFNERIKRNEGIAVTMLDDDFTIPIDKAYAKINHAEVVDGNKIKMYMTLLDTEPGNYIKQLIEYGSKEPVYCSTKEDLELKVDGIVDNDRLDNILNVTIGSTNGSSVI